MCYSFDEVKQRVNSGVAEYNSQAAPEARISRVSVFGSHAEGTQTDDSDVDLLISFNAPVVSLFSLAHVLEIMESNLELPVDVVQDPLPEDALLTINKQVPVYEVV